MCGVRIWERRRKQARPHGGLFKARKIAVKAERSEPKGSLEGKFEEPKISPYRGGARWVRKIINNANLCLQNWVRYSLGMFDWDFYEISITIIPVRLNGLNSGKLHEIF